jgi:hypothetical protein
MYLINHQASKAYEERGEVNKHIFLISILHTSKLSTPHFGWSAIPRPLDSRRGGPRRKTEQDMRGNKVLLMTGIEK